MVAGDGCLCRWVGLQVGHARAEVGAIGVAQWLPRASKHGRLLLRVLVVDVTCVLVVLMEVRMVLVVMMLVVMVLVVLVVVRLV